jgi:hypothetical protein
MRLEQTADRVAKNQSTFRDANEQIERFAEQISGEEPGAASAERFPFICECPDERCREIVRLSLVEYETVRSQGHWFFAVPGHEECVVDGEAVAKVVRRQDEYSLMEKVGRAREVAEELDPR